MKRASGKQRAAALVRKIRAGSEPLHTRATARVVEAQEDDGGRVITVSVEIDGGELVTGVPAVGWHGLAPGARLAMEGVGGATSRQWTISRVTEAADGTGSTDPRGFLSTPSIADVDAPVVVAGDGTIQVLLQVALWLIPEQYHHGQPIKYKVEIRRNDTGEAVATLTSATRARIAGTLYADITNVATSLTAQPYTNTRPPSMDFPLTGGMAQVESEMVRYGGATTSPPNRKILSGLTRGYNSTTAAAHTAGVDVTLRGIILATNGLLPNIAYELRAFAINDTDGRQSNPTDWQIFTTSYDVTPPSWSVTPTPTLADIPLGKEVSWPPADVEFLDLAYYQIQGSTDGSTWNSGDIVNAGNGTSWHYRGAAGDVRWWRVRAVDTSGNESGWSNSVRGAVGLPEEPVTTQLLTNSSFDSNLAGWAFQSGSGAALWERATDIYFVAAGSGRMTETRAGIPRFMEVESAAFAAAANTEVYLRVWLRGSSLNASDAITLSMQYNTSSGAGVIGADTVTLVGSAVGSNWQAVTLRGWVPADASHVRLYAQAFVAAGSGTVNLWLDDLVLGTVTASAPPLMAKGRPFADSLAIGSGGARITSVLHGTSTWNPTSIADGASATTTVTVTGAAVGDICQIAFTSLTSIDWELIGRVTATNTVTVKLTNRTGGAVDLGSGTLRAMVVKF